MAVNQKVVDQLNILLRNELTAINQYFLHSRMCGHLGLKKLEAKEYEESIDEMKHADALIRRILFVGGHPNLQDLGKLFIGENAIEALKCDLLLEQHAHKDLVKALEVMQQEGDNVSEQLVEDILKSEEEHADWLQQQLRLIEQLGEANYLLSQV